MKKFDKLKNIAITTGSLALSATSLIGKTAVKAGKGAIGLGATGAGIAASMLGRPAATTSSSIKDAERVTDASRDVEPISQKDGIGDEEKRDLSSAPSISSTDTDLNFYNEVLKYLRNINNNVDDLRFFIPKIIEDFKLQLEESQYEKVSGKESRQKKSKDEEDESNLMDLLSGLGLLGLCCLCRCPPRGAPNKPQPPVTVPVPIQVPVPEQAPVPVPIQVPVPEQEPVTEPVTPPVPHGPRGRGRGHRKPPVPEPGAPPPRRGRGHRKPPVPIPDTISLEPALSILAAMGILGAIAFLPAVAPAGATAALLVQAARGSLAAIRAIRAAAMARRGVAAELGVATPTVTYADEQSAEKISEISQKIITSSLYSSGLLPAAIAPSDIESWVNQLPPSERDKLFTLLRDYQTTPVPEIGQRILDITDQLVAAKMYGEKEGVSLEPKIDYRSSPLTIDEMKDALPAAYSQRNVGEIISTSTIELDDANEIDSTSQIYIDDTSNNQIPSSKTKNPDISEVPDPNPTVSIHGLINGRIPHTPINYY